MSNEIADIAKAHISGIDLTYRAPELPDAIRMQLPEPILEGHPDWLELYWRAWGIAYDQVTEPSKASGLVPYCDAAFSQNIFQWDTCFMERFLRYAPTEFCAYGSLDNFYLKQHADGFICREIDSVSGEDFWPRDHGSSINPPLFSDAEWSLYQVTSDKKRLADVLEPLIRYHEWTRRHRRLSPDTGYWTTALGSGMDNSPRALDLGGDDAHSPYGYVWMCMTAQQALSARRISQIAVEIGRTDVHQAFAEESDHLSHYVFETFWDASRGVYADLGPDGKISRVLTPAMCWPLLLPQHYPERAKRVAETLTDEAKFWRRHAICSLSADHELFDPEGHYWCGSVWPPMVYLAARAMQATGHFDIANAISENHLENLSEVYASDGTLWENYAPDSAKPGAISRPEFVGWTGCGPIALLIESILGFAVSAPRRLVTWHMLSTARHGIKRLPIGEDRLNLVFDAATESVDVQSETAFDLCIVRDGAEQWFRDLRGQQRLRLS